MRLLCCLSIMLLFSFITPAQLQDNIFSITPNASVCVGESVVITCYLFPPAPNFYLAFALLSINESIPQTFDNINNNFGSIGYMATVNIPVMSDSSRIQLNITSFQVSDSNTEFSCHARLSFDGSLTGAIESGNTTLAAPPSSPVVTLSQPDNNCSNILISWTTPDSDRDIIEYSVYRNNTSLTTTITTDNEYTDTDHLTVNTVYEYSVTAVSCAGSSIGTNTLSIGGYSLSNTPQLFLSYDYTTSILTVDWTLLPVKTPPPLILEYSLYLVYNHTQSGTTDQFSNSSRFSQLSTTTEYGTYIIPHDFSTDDGVVTNITVCIRITQQCGAFTGQIICAYFNSGNLPTAIRPTTNASSATGTSVNDTAATTTQIHPTVADYPVPTVAILIAIIIIIFIISIAVISAMTIALVIMYRKNQRLKSSAKPTTPGHLYQYIDMDKFTPVSSAKPADTYYTPMSPVDTHYSPQDSVTNPQYSTLK